MNPHVESFFDEATFTWTHVVWSATGGPAAIIDPVLDFDPASGRTGTSAAQRVLDFVRSQDLQVSWILETHAHADHLTAAAWLKAQTGAKVAIGAGITQVQTRFKALFGLPSDFPTDGSQFDRLLRDGEQLEIGPLRVDVLATPGHTDDSLSYRIGNAVFIGDTLFAPETGTARVDFPGGDAHKLYASIQRLFDLPADTRVFLCHDYPQGRPASAETTVAAQQAHNIHVGEGRSEAEFVQLRKARDATLAAPRLILPSLQVNIRAGELPPADANGIRYLRLPLNQFG